MFRRIFGKSNKKNAQLDLSTWNKIGREVAIHDSAEFKKFHEGRSDQPNLMDDTRNEELANAVLQEIISLNLKGQADELKGQADEARSHFDPAHAPFISRLEEGGRGLTCCAIIGQDEFLVQQGTTYQENTTWHIKGGQIQKLDDIAGFAWSQNRQHFLIAHQDGSFTIRKKFGSTNFERIPTLRGPDFIPNGLTEKYHHKYGVPTDISAYSQLSISNDGQKILLCDENRGVLLLVNGISGWTPKLLYPSVDLDLKDDMQEFWEDDEEFSPFLDMVHAALSPDGRFVAMGTQDCGHYIIDLENADGPTIYAKLGYISEYPHNACFSDKSEFVALNSCHFYNGVTFASELKKVKNLDTEPYEQHSEQTILNNYLRVYASTYLPASLTNQDMGAFLLAGSGFAACVTPNGKLLWEFSFGSSAGAVDVCSETGRILIASYSGMLHLLDPLQTQDPIIISGYNAPKEIARWIIWDSLDRPIIW